MMMGSRKYSRNVKKVLVTFALIYIMTWDSLSGILVCWTLPGAEAKSGKRRELHLGGIFPINGTGGWQGGQVSYYLYLRKAKSKSVCHE
jgi:hypothetical protein